MRNDAKSEILYEIRIFLLVYVYYSDLSVVIMIGFILIEISY